MIVLCFQGCTHVINNAHKLTTSLGCESGMGRMNILFVYGYFSLCLCTILQGYFLKNRTIFDLEDKLSPVYNMASSGLKKWLDFIILYTLKSVSENVCPVILFLDTKNQILSYVGMWYA